jgi:4-hydroxybenzoate polyprenyltransferase
MVRDFEEIFWKKKLENNSEVKPKNFTYLKKKFLAYLVASRFVNILNMAAFMFLGIWYAVGYFPFNSTLITIFFIIMVQFVHLTNMVFDKKLDIFARKHTIWVFKYISSEEMSLMSVLSFFIGIFVLLFINISVFLFGFILMALTVLYSLPPIRFKTKPPMDSISNMLILGTFPFLVGWLSTGTLFNLNALIYGLIFGLPVITYYLIISWQDIKTDKEFGIKTTCTVLGYDLTIYTSLIIWFVLILLSLYLFYIDISTISFLLIFPILIYMSIIYNKNSEYKKKERNINIFLSLSDLVWVGFIYLSLSYLCLSIIPFVFFIFSLMLSLTSFFRNVKFISKNFN